MQGNKEWEEIVKVTRKIVQQKFDTIYASLDFGAYIQAENYFVSYIFKTTEELENARINGLLDDINSYHKSIMKQSGYPKGAIKDCEFASQDECEKEFGGNWYYYYK